MTSFVIRLATAEDFDDLVGLMRACVGEREFLSKEWYEWFNLGCPAGFNRNYIALDKATGKLAACYGLLPIRIKINDEVLDGSLATNAMTHPEYQGKGLFVQMGKHCLAREHVFRSRITLGVPNQKAYRGHMKVGWRVLSDLAFVAKSSFRTEQCKSKQVPAFDARVGRVIHEIAGQANFIVMKDHRFLNWRYRQRPDKNYMLFIFENKGDVEGYMVVEYFDDNGYKKTHILDILACREEAFNDLILAAERCAIGRDELNCWQTRNSIYERLFANNGFSDTGDRNVLIFHSNYGQEKQPEPSSWWFPLGDNDVY